MTNRTVALEEVTGRSIDDVLSEVASRDEALTVRLPAGQEIIIRLKPHLKPLPELAGSVPGDWKDEVYK
jgi:hypothetical protein